MILVRPALPRGDRGSAAVATVIFALIFITLAAFMIDGSLAIHQRDRASEMAEQAARYAAAQVNERSLRGGKLVAPGVAACTAYVRAYLAATQVDASDQANSGCLNSPRADTVSVRVRLTYTPIFTGSLFGGTVWGNAQARAVNQ